MQRSPNPQVKKSGLSYWAESVLLECDNASREFASDPVHDLRVAIRRCRSMADGFLSVDPDPGWKQMKRSAKPLFSALGELRDSQVMSEWLARISPELDPVRQVLTQTLQQREAAQKAAAEEALHNFDRKHWLSLTARLSTRTAKIPVEGLVFQHLALERWMDARELHRRALRNRSQTSYHRLRIGIKRFRYTLENFLPERHEKWGRALRELQDDLGDVHDLDVLSAMIRQHNEVPAPDRLKWQARIVEQRQQRLDRYRDKMLGSNSLWWVWRSELPSGSQLQQASMQKLRTWASFLDPDRAHAVRVTHIALQLYDVLSRQGRLAFDSEYRQMLEAAALLHEVGRGKEERGHRNRGYRMIRKLKPPLSWDEEQLHCVAAVARLHRGKLPQEHDSSFVGLDAQRRKRLLVLGGILRLANAFDWDHEGRISRVSAEQRDGLIVLQGEGLQPLGRAAERLARERYLLETAFGMPVVIRPLTAKPVSSARKRLQVRAASGS
jgi:CHAD domain-containing protein